MSRTLAPLRSLSSVVSRRSVASANVLPRYARPYSTEGSSAPSSTEGMSAEELSKKVGELESVKAELEQKAAEAETKVKDVQKDMKYLQAEIQTLSRRVTEERQKASEFAISSFARNLISTTDILSQALKHVPKPVEPGTPLESLFNGVEMTQKAMYKVFGEHGVKVMELSKGSQFDPNLHEATFQIPASVAGPKEGGGEWGPGEVVEIGKEGWMIGNRVLRPAQVGVTQIE